MAPHQLRLGVNIDPPGTDHAHESGEAAQSVRVHAVARGFGEQAGTQQRALFRETEAAERARDCLE